VRAAVALLALALVGCDAKPEPTAIQRGEAVFRPVADRFAAGIVADLKKSDAAGFDRYLKEIGGKVDADLVRKVSTETLTHYAEALSMSSAKEAELKAGRFDDSMNRRKVKAAQEKFSAPKATVPHVCQVLLNRQQAGEWGAGLELEFSARILEGQLRMGKD